MNIGFDAKRLYCNFTGLGNYSRSLVKNVQNAYPHHNYHLFTTKRRSTPETDYFYDHADLQTFVSKATLKAYWRSFSIVKNLENKQIDLYHGLSNEVPFTIGRSTVKSVVTIHDLIFKVLPDTYPLIDRSIYDLKFRSSCRNADRVVAISESTKGDIMQSYGIASEKIDVIYQSCHPSYYAAGDHTDTAGDLDKYDLPTDFLLYVGTIEPRKNLHTILSAYQYLLADHQIPLVVVGGFRGKAYRASILQQIETYGLAQKIHLIHDLKGQTALQALYRKAQMLVYPSFYEGFGLPVAEALLCKIPVVTSNRSSLPEAGGPDSAYVDPTDAEELAQAISRVLSDSEQRSKMIDRGFSYATHQFSPRRVTEQMMACYAKTMEQ